MSDWPVLFCLSFFSIVNDEFLGDIQYLSRHVAFLQPKNNNAYRNKNRDHKGSADFYPYALKKRCTQEEL